MDTNLFDILEEYTDDDIDDSQLDSSFTEGPGIDAGYGFETGNGYGNNCVRLFNGSVCYDSNNASDDDDDEGTLVPWSHNHWTLVLLVFPIFTVFGNVLVVLSVYREKTLQTVTNYFIVSLAIADIMVAILVMPLAVYVEVNNGLWELGDGLCDTWVALDVMCCTASILNLAAISVDRFVAVTQPIKYVMYAKHKNSKRVYMMLALSWVISITISSPIALGMNYTERRMQSPYLCTFYNSDFLIYSSMGSFYIPCIVMVLLYWRIFHAIRMRARKSSSSAASSIPKGRTAVTANNRTHQSVERELITENRGVRGGTTSDATSAAEDVACRMELLPKEGPFPRALSSGGNSLRHQFTPVVEETSIDDGVPTMNCAVKTSRSIEDGAGEDETEGVIEEEEEGSPLQGTQCRANGSSGRGVYDGSDAEPFASIEAAPRRGSYWRKGSTGHALAVYCPPATVHIEHCNQVVDHDTPSPLSTASIASSFGHVIRPPPLQHTRPRSASSDVVMATTIVASPAGNHQNSGGCCNRGTNGEGDGVISIRSCSIGNHRKSRGGGGGGGGGGGTMVTKFNFRLRRETSAGAGGGGGGKKKERNSQTAHKRERKATKTLAIVLGVFLFCWVPFFTINIMNAICIRYDLFDNHRICQIDPMLFSFFVWLGYMNSFLNPAIYTIFNMEFRRAFKNLLTTKCKWR